MWYPVTVELIRIFLQQLLQNVNVRISNLSLQRRKELLSFAVAGHNIPYSAKHLNHNSDHTSSESVAI